MKSWPKLDIPALPVSVGEISLLDAMTGEVRKFIVPSDTSYIYVCGITPYDSTHIGHATTYVFFDVLHRLLIATQKPIVMIENITDIDDPLFNKAKELGRDWQELASEQVSRFSKDMTLLRVLPPQNFVAVSESMDVLLLHIQELIQNGAAYYLDGDVYFKYQGGMATEVEVRIFKERGGDPERSNKHHPLDSVLWKVTEELPNFPSPWGAGRPGWHIECVSIIERFAQKPLLVQGGGSDLKFPHHTMSHQQFCELTSHSQLAHVYFHVAMVMYQGQKMSKSLGNLVFIDKLLEQGASAMEIRYAILMQDYCLEWEWQSDILEEARVRYARLIAALSCENTADGENTVREIVRLLCDNLNTPTALDVLDQWAKSTLLGTGNHSHAGVVARTVDALLGIGT